MSRRRGLGTVATMQTLSGILYHAGCAQEAFCDHDRFLSRNFVADAVENLLPSVVQLQCKRGIMESSGSGFFVAKDGFIVTNAHVVGNAKIIHVTLSNSKIKSAKVHGIDQQSDIAVVKLDDQSEPYPAAPIGMSEKLRPGEFVVAIGSPARLRESVTFGIVSSCARLGLGTNARAAYIQTDAAINQGNSGGPLVNLDGEVVGINVMKLENANGISFAIPMDVASQVINQLITQGKVVRPYVGLHIVNILPVEATKESSSSAKRASNSTISDETNALITSVDKNSPAMKAGLKPGDIVLEINRRKITCIFDCFQAIGLDINKTLDVKIERENTYGFKEVMSFRMTTVSAG